MGHGDRRTTEPCGLASLLHAAINRRSCLKMEGEDDTGGSPPLYTLAFDALLLTHKCTHLWERREWGDRGRREGREKIEEEGETYS